MSFFQNFYIFWLFMCQRKHLSTLKNIQTISFLSLNIWHVLFTIKNLAWIMCKSFHDVFIYIFMASWKSFGNRVAAPCETVQVANIILFKILGCQHENPVFLNCYFMSFACNMSFPRPEFETIRSVWFQVSVELDIFCMLYYWY